MSEEITLDYPVPSDGIEVSTLTVRRPKVRDQINAAKVPGTDQDREVRMFAELCGVTTGVIEDLDMADYAKLQDAYRGFMKPRQTTSGKSA